ncbi:MAG: hypothetical protein AB8G95_31050 [Anaerolineae bacterium]
MLEISAQPEDEFLKDIAVDLERVKWYLWHGNVFRACKYIEVIESDLEISESKPFISQETA